jgi:hypothetical protein
MEILLMGGFVRLIDGKGDELHATRLDVDRIYARDEVRITARDGAGTLAVLAVPGGMVDQLALDLVAQRRLLLADGASAFRSDVDGPDAVIAL